MLAPLSLFVLLPAMLRARSSVMADSTPALPSTAQVIDYKSFAVLDTVLPPSQFNGTSLFYPPGTTNDSLLAKPFHVYHPDFYAVIGTAPSLTLIADGGTDPLFHEAVTWDPKSDSVFFVQNSGAPAAGTGLNKSGILQKISLAETASIVAAGNGALVNVTTVNTTPQIINPNGGTNYKNNLIFAGEGQGDNIPPTLYLVNPEPPYNSTALLNNFFGRQFNSLNDVAINPRNKELYFTDVTYAYLQDFRPNAGVRNQVWRLDIDSGRISAVADGFNLPNGLTFSPDGEYLYVTDTGINQAFFGYNFSYPSSIYRYDVQSDGSLTNRELFTYVHVGIPDGIHCDAAGNVYAGVGDGVHVWNPAGQLIGKIYVGAVSANFQFAGSYRMVICAETKLYYAELNATGAPITDYDYSQILP